MQDVFKSAKYRRIARRVGALQRGYRKRQVMLRAAQKNVRHQITAARRGRTRCLCNARSIANRSYAAALRTMRSQRKELLRLLRLRCYINRSKNCGRVRISAAMSRKLSVRRPRLMSAARRAKCGGRRGRHIKYFWGRYQRRGRKLYRMRIGKRMYRGRFRTVSKRWRLIRNRL